MTCPVGHTDYLSQHLADTAVTLHAMSRPNCTGYNAWSCGDHWHAGHPDRAIGDACKTDPEHVATKRRVQEVCRRSRPRARRRR